MLATRTWLARPNVWRGGPVDYRGRHYSVTDARVSEPPNPLPQLYFGGSSPTTSGKRLRVLSLNVEAQNKNYPAVRQLVDSTKPDFVVLLDVSVDRVHPSCALIGDPARANIRHTRAIYGDGLKER